MDGPAPIFQGSPKGPFLLILTSPPTAAARLRAFLEKEGYDTRAVSKPEDVLPAARERRPLALLVDLDLPDRLGYKVSESLLYNETLPCITFSSRDHGVPIHFDDERELAILKPVSLDNLLACLHWLRRTPGKPPPHVLVVDDEEPVRKTLRAFLTRAGYTPIEASDGAMAIAIALQAPPDAILLDLRMPGMDGFQVAERLKTYTRTRDIPILVLTGKPLSEEERSRLKPKVFSISEKGQVPFEKLLAHLKWVEKIQAER